MHQVHRFPLAHMTMSMIRSLPLRLPRLMAKASLIALAAGTLASHAPAQDLTPMPDTGSAAMASAPGFTPGEQTPQLPTLGEGILVSVNDDMITSYDLKQRILLLIVTSGVQVTNENYPAFQQQAMQSLID